MPVNVDAATAPAGRSQARRRLRAAVVIVAAAWAPSAAAAAQDAAPVHVAEHVTLRWDAPDPACPEPSRRRRSRA